MPFSFQASSLQKYILKQKLAVVNKSNTCPNSSFLESENSGAENEELKMKG